MNIDTSSLLTLFSTKLNKTTKQTIEKLSVDGKVNISSILQEKSIQTLLNSLFQDILNGTKTKNNVNQLLLANKQVFDIKTISYDIKNILKLIEQNPKLEKQSSVLKEFILNVKDIDSKSIKSNIANSGIYLESKLLKQDKSVSNDLKVVVSQVNEYFESKSIDISKDIKHSIEKIQTQIEFYQLSSYSSTSNHTFLPFNWEELNDADIKFSSQKKDNFSCQINLSLKEHGELKILLKLSNKNNLIIDIGTESLQLKQYIQEYLQKLRISIHSIGLQIQQINIFDINTNISNDINKYEQDKYYINKLSLDVDIKV